MAKNVKLVQILFINRKEKGSKNVGINYRKTIVLKVSLLIEKVVEMSCRKLAPGWHFCLERATQFESVTC